MPQDDKRTALVTGAGSGIGFAVARRLLACGYTVVAMDVRFAQDEGSHPQLQQVVGDVTRENDCADAVSAAGEHVDLIVNAAAVRTAEALADTDDANWQRCLDVNVTGAFTLLKAVIPRLREGRGCVFNIGSAAAYGRRNLAAYGASKAALISLSRTAAIELAPLGIRVNVVLPGTTDTGMLARAHDSASRAGNFEAPRNFGGQVLSADSVAENIEILVHANLMTGAVIPIGLIPWEW